MGVGQKILSGARAQLIVNGKIVGLFTNCSWGVSYDAIPSYILGRFSPAEITYAGQEAIAVQATGFRIIDNGAYVAAALPKLQDLLTHEDISLAVYDRQTNKQIMLVVGVRPVSYSTDVSARAISSFSCNFLGLRSEDESGSQGEGPGASDLLSGS
jgi:maltoporin